MGQHQHAMTDGSKLAAEPPSHRVQHLLAVARGEFVARGFDAVSIDAIARAGNVSKETIYRHFADKEALFRAALELAGAEFTARAQAVHQAASHPRIELAWLARTIIDATVDQGLFSVLWVATSVAHRMPDVASVLRDQQWARMEPVRLALEEYARQQGLARHVPLELALDFGSLAVEGPALLMGLPAPGKDERDRLAGQAALLFSQGIEPWLGGMTDTAIMPPTVPGGTQALPDHIRNLLDVAGRHFLEQGYEGANLDLIGAQARVGRGTLYRHFGSKAGLFAAALRHHARNVAVTQAPPLPSARLDRAALEAFLDAAIASLADAPSIQLHRAAISQSRRDPETARAIYAILREPWAGPLSHWLGTLGARDDREWLARQLLVLATRGNRLFGADQTVAQDDRRRFAKRAAAIFLHGFTSLL